MGKDNPDRERVAQFATRVIEAFPTPPDCMFHLECFLTPGGEIVLCEVACRLGGNGINEEVRLSYDVDMKIEWLFSQLQGIAGEERPQGAKVSQETCSRDASSSRRGMGRS